MKTRQFLWRLVRFQPWFYALNCLSVTLVIVLEMVPGLIARQVFDGLAAHLQVEAIFWQLAALLLLSGLGRIVFLFGCQLTNAPFILVNSALMQKNLFARILQLPGARALPISPGEAVSRFRDDVEDSAVFPTRFNDLIALTIFALISLIIMLKINVTITLVVFIPMVLIVSAVQVASNSIKKRRGASREATSKVTGFLGEMFRALYAIKVASAEEQVLEHFRGLNDTRRKLTVRDRLFEQIMGSIFLNTVSLGTGLILLLAAQMMNTTSFTVGDFALFVYYLNWITEFVTQLGTMLTHYKQIEVSFERLVKFLQGAPAQTLVQYSPLYLKGDVPKLHGIPEPTHDRRLDLLRVEGLTYRYPDSDRGIQNISFSLKSGSFTVITGRVGAGKTTLLKTLQGLLPGESGTIYWNGLPVESPASFFVPPYSAYTPQVPRLFSETLRDNILLGLPEENGNLAATLHLAVLESDIAETRQGLDTLVGPKGVRLSGGQIQRTAAARMFVRPAELLIFDDLSSALDVETETTLWQRVFASSKATILTVSHRSAALRHADHIIVLKEGKIEAEGTLEELLETSLETQRLWREDIYAAESSAAGD